MADSTVTIDNLQKELKKAKDTIESSDSNSNGKTGLPGLIFFSVHKIPWLFRFSQLIFNADFRKWFVIYHAFFEYCAKNTNDVIFRHNVV